MLSHINNIAVPFPIVQHSPNASQSTMQACLRLPSFALRILKC